MKDRAILWLISLLFLCSGLKIQIGDRLILEQSYAFTCSGAKGDVNYQFRYLPIGVLADNNRIFIQKQRRPIDGSYFIEIKAEDSQKQTSQKQIILTVHKVRSAISISEKSLFNPEWTVIKNEQSGKNQKIYGELPKIQKSFLGFQITTKANSRLLTNLRRAQQVSKQVVPSEIEPDPDYSGINKIMQFLNLPAELQIVPNPPQPKVNPIDKIPVVSTPMSTEIDALLISTKKASTVFTTLRKPPPTESELRTTAAFNRQIAANKAVSNLLAIVKQATANRNFALEQFKLRQQTYEQDQNNKQQKNQTLFESQLEYSQNYQMLLKTTQSMKTMKKRTEDVFSNITFKNKQKQQIAKNLQQNQDKIIQADILIQLTLDQTAQLNSTKLRKQSQCEILDNQFGTIMDKKENKIDQIVDVKMRLVPARREVQLTQDIINDLKAKLAKAEKSMKQSLSVVHYYQAQQRLLTENLTKIQDDANSTKIKVDTCHDQLNNITSQIFKNQNEKIANLRKTKAQAKAKIKIQADNLSQLNKQLQQLPKEFTQLKKNIQISQNNIMALQSILADISPRIFIQQGQSFDANEAAQKSKQNLQAILKKIQDEQKTLDEATANLQKARVQKQQADQEVNNVLTAGSNVPLFATTTINNEYPSLNTLNTLISKQISDLAKNKTEGEAEKPIDTTNLDKMSDILKNLTLNASSDKAPQKNTSDIQISNLTRNSPPTPKNQTIPTNISQADANTPASPVSVSNQLDYFVYSGAARYLIPIGNGNYQIKNMPEFILNFFGPKIQAPYLDNSTLLYPIKPQFNLIEIECPPKTQISTSGYVISTRLNSFGLLTSSGELFEVFYSSVIKLFSIEPSVEIVPGSKVILRAVPKENNQLLATFVFFLSL